MWLKVFAVIVCVCQLRAVVEAVSFEEDIRISFEQTGWAQPLRRRVQSYITEDYMKEDIYLVRWLRAANFNINQAEQRFIENIKWRREARMATIDREDFSDISQEYPYSDDGFDKEGRPLFIAFVGEWDIRSAVVTGRVNRVLRYLDQGLENLQKRIFRYQREGKNVTQAVLVLELSQFYLVQHACVQCLMRIVDFLHSYESHYPGTADKVFFVGAPPAVQFVIELVKQNVSKETRDAIQTYGTNKDQWQQVLRKYIDKKYLPIELGGTMDRV